MRSRNFSALLSLVLLATACGGGGSDGSGQPNVNPPPPPAPVSSVNLSSDAGDYIGGGQSYSYTYANSHIGLSTNGGGLTMSIDGDESWQALFKLPSTFTRLEPGTYSNLTRHSGHDPAVGGMEWTGEGRGCNSLVGTLTIHRAVYNGATLTLLEMEFEQYCEGGTAALRGEIFWDASAPTTPPGPQVPPPAGLWTPAAGATPATGNYVYLQSQAGDFIGQGATYLYTNATASLTVNAGNAHLSVSVDGDQRWYGDFRAMSSISFLEAGYYGDLRRYPFHNPAKGGLSWWGDGRGCNTLEGWFVVDSVRYTGNTLAAITLRFEQRCDGVSAPLRGKIYWDVNNDTSAPGPVVPPPAGLWQPAQGVTPATGSFVYLESKPGDWVGQGGNYLYTLADSLFVVNAGAGRLDFGVIGDESWSGEFQPMESLSRLEVGYYGDLQRFPFHNPVKGGLSWTGEGRGCNTLAGWFVVDSVTYNGNVLMAVELRFEQRCDGGPALNGKIRWDASEPSSAPGPVMPLPAGLWEPAPGITPASGTYVYLESDFGDWVGQGANYLYTLADSNISFNSTGGQFALRVTGDEQWNGDFQTMNSLTRFEVGYYGNLTRFPFHNPVRGGLSWYGEGRGCSQLQGWFVVDSVTYNGDSLVALDLRFEQRCDGGPPLNGKIHWDPNDTTTAPGPVVPPPAGLWTPPAQVIPATGNYVYLESQVGDWIGQGANYLYTNNSQISIGSPGGSLWVVINGSERWDGNFQAMNSLNYLQVGYYGDLQRYPFHNPVKGGLNWGGNGRNCNTVSGWFVIDSVSYVGVTLSSIEMRFEQHCEGGGPALRGAIRWGL